METSSQNNAEKISGLAIDLTTFAERMIRAFKNGTFNAYSIVDKAIWSKDLIASRIDDQAIASNMRDLVSKMEDFASGTRQAEESFDYLEDCLWDAVGNVAPYISNTHIAQLRDFDQNSRILSMVQAEDQAA